MWIEGAAAAAATTSRARPGDNGSDADRSASVGMSASLLLKYLPPACGTIAFGACADRNPQVGTDGRAAGAEWHVRGACLACWYRRKETKGSPRWQRVAAGRRRRSGRG
ncbi:hypothetical protein FRAAL1587 [Frankia alni ACN14a]|uniref:Uncharacterized protein n=1 Tax=Frankia alni (strain DSM 45986 / CECT 9034 / ACN14a) TaxID=326424 RepID=Q0RQD3_FRAAA|nr:hypothetical protein FRAAL1587 [Frankia alni ACN14a]